MIMSAFSVAILFAVLLCLCCGTHCCSSLFLMPVAQRLPLDPVHPFESSDGEQGHYANALNARKEEEAKLMLWKKKKKSTAVR